MVSFTDRYEPWTLTPYEKWVTDEGLHVHTQQLVDDIHTIDVEPWERTGTKAACQSGPNHGRSLAGRPGRREPVAPPRPLDRPDGPQGRARLAPPARLPAPRPSVAPKSAGIPRRSPAMLLYGREKGQRYLRQGSPAREAPRGRP